MTGVDGDHTALDVTAVALLDGEFAGDPNPLSVSIAPTRTETFVFLLARPEQADFESGQHLTFHGKTFSARVTCRRRSATVRHGEQARLR